MVQTLLIDNYDSFTYNLAELLTKVNGHAPVVVTNDAPWNSLDLHAFDNIVVSPGPGSPTVAADFGISEQVMNGSGLPVLGVCLGHQGLCSAFGARIVRAPHPMHGRLSRIRHAGRDLFAGLPCPMSVVRYHSLVAVGLPDELEVLARTDDGLVMGVRHRDRPLWGVQFHPESIAAEHGETLLANFRDLSVAANAAGRPKRTTSVPYEQARQSLPTPTDFVVTHRRLECEPDPGRLYRKLFAGRRGAFWLDRRSAEPGCRYTVMGDATGPRAEYLTYDVATRQVSTESRGVTTVRRVSSLFDHLKLTLLDRAVRRDPDLPFDFHLGYVGYLGYELKAETGGSPAHHSPYPDAALVFADRAVVIDHENHCSFLLSMSDDDAQWCDRTAAALLAAGRPADRGVGTEVIAGRKDTPIALRLGADEYRARIEESLDLIRAGQTYEVCLTTTARFDRAVDHLAVFDRVRALNPVPHAALLEFPGIAVISASPERFVRIRPDRSIESKPIKGTRPRGDTPAADRALSAALYASEKERAENLMIVDLVRNDLSRVCEPGSVDVPRLFDVETYASVHQLVSTVRGVLRGDAHPVDALRALFPAGSMTGAPKVRTMEILDRLEAAPRGVYSGALGYLSLSGAVDLSVVIRTMVASASGVEFGVGGAITALSDPTEEYAEILVKAVSSQRVLTDEAPSRPSGEFGPSPQQAQPDWHLTADRV
ncbi:aminodeoxychorismate synthase component I [Mycolicibacterium wolinskyi]|uniref:aminodeoxychorismate synthase n=1 Tax=Mycolicibacterium wolinskyi TaxID=59750 RepID=A0A1X2F858_9MYCO|nr:MULTISPECIES: aminodeoxychorismate synthase component I [Mycolicibacterium]MCV7286676.1 aminodeoxychorismate synthase component I [Mycolicibacterium wolinskyi]MCV7293656.1 aminodeoxychorismate synthase component I [Mycolicibacterium goodii]ORX14622.1 aminobenzoate synthetase [Mycolicibacterium wolinskyi]